MIINNLTNDNIEIYCMKSYDNPQCISMQDYLEDMKILKYIKRLLNRYDVDGELREKLLLKHIIMWYNIFAAEAATRILFFYISAKHYPTLKTFLIYLNFMPKIVKGINGIDIYSSNIKLDEYAVIQLRAL